MAEVDTAFPVMVHTESMNASGFTSDHFETDPKFHDYESAETAKTCVLSEKEPPQHNQRNRKPKFNKKRKAPDSDENPFTSPTKVLRFYTPEKNPISILNDLGLPGSAYHTADPGETVKGASAFKMTVEVNGEVFEGLGASKRQAKETAARNAVNAIVDRINLGAQTPLETPINGGYSLEVPDQIKLEESVAPVVPQTSNPTADPDAASIFSVPAASTANSIVADGASNVRSEGTRVNVPFRVLPAAAAVESIGQLISLVRNVNTGRREKLLDSMKEAAGLNGVIHNPVGIAVNMANVLRLSHQFMECNPAVGSDDIPEQMRGSLTAKHVAKMVVLNETFYASASTKKAAKQLVAGQFLSWMLDVLPGVWRMVCVADPLQVEAAAGNGYEASPESSSKFAEHFSILVSQKLHDISFKLAGNPLQNYLDHKGIAAVCVSRGGNLSLVALATGSSVLYRKCVSTRGLRVKDCQAEILALRATKRYILEQVLAFYHGSESIFQSISEDGRLQLLSDVGFHLFLSRSPCGTCAVLQSKCMPDSLASEAEKLHVIDGEIVSVNCRVARTDDVDDKSVSDITDGNEKLQIMSSSDKLMKKLVVGIQGALASCFTQPIFLQTISVTGDLAPDAIAQGLYTRLLRGMPTEKALDTEFPLVCPEISRIPENPVAGKFPYKEALALKGFVWYAGRHNTDGAEEFLETSTGLTNSQKHSSLCKQNMGMLFKSVSDLVAKRKEPVLSVNEITKDVVTYKDAKHASPFYRKKIDFFRTAVDTAELGTFVAKCNDEEHFFLVSQAE